MSGDSEAYIGVAPFLGLEGAIGANISSVVISLTSASNNLTSDLAIGQLSLQTVASTPEPSSIGITIGLVMGMVALASRRKKMVQRCE